MSRIKAVKNIFNPSDVSDFRLSPDYSQYSSLVKTDDIPLDQATTIDEVKKVVENRGKTLDDSYERTIWTDDILNREKSTLPLNEVYPDAGPDSFTSGKSVNEIISQDYKGNVPVKPKSTEPRNIINKAHVSLSKVRPQNADEVLDVIKEETIKTDGFINPNYENSRADGTFSAYSTINDIDLYVTKGKERFKSSSSGASNIHSDFIVPKEYQRLVEFGSQKYPQNRFPNYTQGGERTPFNKGSEGFLTTTIRNTSYHNHYEGQIYRWLTEQKIIEKAFKDGKIPKSRYKQDMIDAKDYIKFLVEDMEKLGIETKVWNKKKKGFDTYGKRYGDKQKSTLYKDQKETYDLNIPPQGDQLLSQHNKNKVDALEILREKRKNNDMSGTGVKPEGHNKGGFARRMMAIGGDMSQFTETEEVVSTPDGMEGQVDLAMSFKNPFKIKKPPPLFDESAANLKISGAVDDIKATETVADTNKGIFTLKSETEIMNSPQESMVGGQWLGFLKKKGVSITELDEFGLGNYLNANQNVKINKNDLMNAYKDLKPIITYDIHQKEPFKKGADDLLSFLTKRDSGGGYYHGTKGIEEIRGLNNKPQDIAGDSMRVQLAEIFKAPGNDATLMMEQGAETINKVFKQFYGIDNVLKNGIPEGSKIPFYSKNLVERFKRLHSGDGFYMSKKTPKHEGVQFLDGGTGYIEIPITYNPNPKGPRAKEPAYTEGSGHFANTKGNHPVFWMRASERTDEAGRRVLFIEEIQSDLHQGVQQKGKKYSERLDKPGKVNISALNSQRIKLADELNKITEQIDKVKGHTDPSTQTVLARLQTKRYSIREELNTINKQLDEMDMTADGVPEAPFKKSENQAKIAIKIALNLARENGYDGVVMISGKAKNYGAKASGTNAKGNLGFYNNIAAKAMKNAAKNNGLDFSSTNIKDGKGNTWAKLPYINIKGTPTQPVDMYKNTGGYIHYPSFVDVVPTL